MATKLSNVIGARFSDTVLRQLSIRAYNNSAGQNTADNNGIRTNSQILFLANKSAWARLTSSVQITPPPPAKNYVMQSSATGFNVNTIVPQVGNNFQGNIPYSPSYVAPPPAASFSEFYKQFNLDASIYKTGDDLAKNWVLEAGTSIQNGNGITLRQGIGPNGAYGLGGTQELGYRPMPGLTSVTIDTTGRLGSLRQATINFKVWNMDQLNIIEALYFRLGYSMLLEWGHTQYFKNGKNPKVNDFEPKGIFTTNEVYGIGDPFVSNLRKEDVQQLIARKVNETSGNYDGMLGIVSNFNWSFNQDGGYDCMVRLVGLGAVMDSMKINQVYTLPQGLLKEYKRVQEGLNAYYDAQLAKLQKEIDDLARKNNGQQEAPLEALPTNSVQLYQIALAHYYFNNTTTQNQFDAEFGAFAFSKLSITGQLGQLDYFVNFPTDAAAESKFGGLWLSNHPVGKFTRVTPSSKVIVDTGLINTGIDNYPSKIFIEGDYVDSKGKPYTLSDVSYQNSLLARFLDYETQAYTTNNEGVYDKTTVALFDVLPTKYWKFGVTYEFKNVGTYGTNTKSVYFGLGWQVDTPRDNALFIPTKQQLLDALQNWEANNSQMQLTSIEKKGKDDIEVKGSFTTPIENVVLSIPGLTDEKKKSIINNNLGSVKEQGGTLTKTVNVTWGITTNNTGFIQDVANVINNAPNTNETGTGATGDTNGTVNQANNVQTEAAESFTSALDAMLTLVQSEAQFQAIDKKGVTIVPLYGEKGKFITEKFYAQGSLNGVFGDLNKESIDAVLRGKFDLVAYAKKGFNSNLMNNPTLYPNIPYVDFKAMSNAYVVNYAQNGPDNITDARSKSVYITLGYLIAFLNNMCMIYDSTQSEATINQTSDTKKRPYVYIDLNPETNFCLTSQQQLSVDPTTCLIPFNCSNGEYKAIFPTDVNTDLFKDPALFKPESENVLSTDLYGDGKGLTFKTGDKANSNNNQGKTMNILLRVEYLLNTLKSFTSNDPHNAVILQPFLEHIMSDINKCLGNTNLFRVAYRDDTNTIQIQDDQWVPNLSSEPSLLNQAAFLDRLQHEPILSGELPVFGSGAQGNTLSLTRQFQFKTVMSTKLASMIAISAQANTNSVNSTDHSSLSYLNQHYTDRYKPYVQNPSNPTGANVNNVSKNVNGETPNKGESNNQKLAALFNQHVINVYSNFYLDPEKIQMAKNYYIERMSHVKSDDPVTSSAPFIPADLEMTLDGVSGIIMGNGFTIPANRLPISLRETTGNGKSFSKVGFIVTGLTHTIQSNEWLTRIKGQMIKLRTDQQRATTNNTAQQTAVANPTKAGSVLTGNIIEDAVNFIKNQEKLYSAKKGAYVELPSNSSQTTLVYAYTSGGDIPTIGWGTTNYNTGVKKGQAVALGDSITVSQADAEIHAEVASVSSYVKNNLKATTQLTNGQLVALLSLGYNLGVGNLSSSPIWQSIEGGQSAQSTATIIAGYGLTVKATGNVAGGLIARRKQESQLFLS